MVRRLQDCDSTRDRAQLILVGSIALAFIIIGLVVVFNTVLFTDNLAAQGSVGEIENAQEFQQQVERDMPELVRHVENGTDSNTAFSGNVDGNVSTTYNRLLAETYADGSPTYVNVTFNESSSTFGTRVVQNNDTKFNSSGDTSNLDWEPVQPGDPRYIGQFETNITTGELLDVSGSDNFTIVLRSESASEPPVHIQLSDDTGTLVLNQTRGSGITQNVCTIPDSHVRLNITNGSAPNHSACSFNSTNVLSGPYSMEFRNVDNVQGNYSFVVNGTVDSHPGIVWDRDGPATPYANRVLLEAGVDLYYQSRTVTYVSNQTITVREVPK
ncbi:hypothetical protein [Halostella sp. PRR32]|uniref:DUF7261 family protein n=1 Tax=Halostella sp. PRR32 TaxID=3098147 RepID=UPI002B1D2A0B|nr:hypothetical protein [Halostella sp. PRR32]